jgi:Protein of unknown function (DUF1631)
MSESIFSLFAPKNSPDSSATSASKSRDLADYPELLILFQDVKNKSRLTPNDFPMVFAELTSRRSELGTTEFDPEIDFLSRLFNMIFSDRDLPDVIKVQLARLQINLLISVIQEKGFLNHSSNPARRLLDTVVRTEVDLVLSGNLKLSGVEVLNEGIDKIFNCEVVEFKSYRELLEQYRDQTTKRSVPETSIEQPDQATDVSKTTQTVRSMIQQLTLPLQAQKKSTILFDKVWAPMLSQIALTDGLNSSSWIKAVQTVKTQVWALTPKTTEHDHQKLLTMMPKVSLVLAKTMNALKLPADLQKSLKEHWTLEQAKVMQSTEENLGPLRQNPRTRTQANHPENNNKKIISKPDGPPQVTKPDTHPPEALETGQSAEIVTSEAEKLKLGDWIEIYHEDSEIMVKLTWRSEDTSMFIFVDREGNRVREIDGDTLDNEVASGQIKLASSKSDSIQKSRLSFLNILKS